jgi:Lamin Tail Domain
MKKTLSILAGLLATHASFGAIYITEIMYDPKDSGGMPDSSYEFVEIYNSSAVSSVNVQDWTVAAGGSGDLSITSSSLVLAPGAFLVIGNTTIGAFNSAYNVNLSSSQYVQAAGALPSLSNSSSTITIKDSTTATQATVSYSNGSGWPTGIEGNSITLGFLPVYAAPGDYQIGSNWANHNSTIFDPNGLQATRSDAGGFASPGYMIPVPEPTSAILMGFGILLLRRIRSKK